jgi:putative glutamine amidotransferase
MHADPQRAIFKGKTLVYAEQSILNYVMLDGDLAYMVPTAGVFDGRRTVSLGQLADDLDGLVLQGGSDVAPESYGEEPIDPRWTGDRVRDLYESELMMAFMQRDKPVLGICRGLQLINVALGGTLYQDITTQVPDTLDHRDWHIYDECVHDVDIVPGSELAALYGTHRGSVTSVHHQAIKDLAPGLVVDATSTVDGIIEAVRRPRTAPGDPYIVGVQWHPEFQEDRLDSLLDARVLMRDFLAAVTQRRGE